MSEEDRELEEILQKMAWRLARQDKKSAESNIEEPVKYITSYRVFHETICRNPVVVAIFTSPTCPACRVYKPIFYRYAAEASQKLGGRVVFAEVDVFYAPEAAYEVGVMSTPTTVIFKGCKPVDGFVGIADEDTLNEFIVKYLD